MKYKAFSLILGIALLMLSLTTSASAQTAYVFNQQNNIIMPLPVHDLQPINNENIGEIIELAEFQYFNELGTSVSASNFAFSPDGSLLAFSLYYRDEALYISDNTTIAVVDVATGIESTRVKLNVEDQLSENLQSIFGLHFSPDSSMLIAWSSDGGAVWGLEQLRVTRDVSLLNMSDHGFIDGLFFGDDSIPYWIITFSTPRLENALTNDEVEGWRSGIVADNFSGLQSSASGEIYALYPDIHHDLVVIYNQAGDELLSLEQRGSYSTLDLSLDGRFIAVSQPEDQTIEVWNIEAQEIAYVFENPTDSYDVVKFSLNGTWLIARVQINGRWIARIFDMNTGEMFYESRSDLQYHAVAGVMNQHMSISVDWFEEGERGFRIYGIPRCAVRALREVNMREGVGTNFNALEVLPADAVGFVDGQTTGDDGFIWWHLTNGLYVREDTVEEIGTDCMGVPTVQS